MSFPNLVPTDLGKEAMLKVIEGEDIVFTRIGLGNGDKPKNQNEIEALQNLVCYGTITGWERDGINARLHWSLATLEIENEFLWKEYGLFASPNPIFEEYIDEEGKTQRRVVDYGDEFLFSYAYDDSNSPQPISDVNSSSITSIEVDINITVGNAENINVVIGDYSQYTTQKTFKDHIEAKNPHKITAEMLGLENVENVSVDEAIPTIEEIESFRNLESGDKTSTLWGKVKRAITTLSEHTVKKGNPHETKASDVGAAEKTHNHAATDINSGVLGVTRGGTGTNSLASFFGTNLANAKTHVRLANARYLRGTATDGKEVSLIGFGSDDQIYAGSELAKQFHIHTQDEFCLRITNGGYHHYYNFEKKGNANYLIPFRKNVSTGVNSKFEPNLGSSTYPFGHIYSCGSLHTSDRKEKKNIEEFLIGKELIKQISFVKFNFINSDKNNVGVIAQDVFDICQNLDIKNSNLYSVSLVDDKGLEIKRDLTDEEILEFDDKHLVWSIDYQQLTNCLIAGLIQYQNEIETRLTALENK